MYVRVCVCVCVCMLGMGTVASLYYNQGLAMQQLMTVLIVCVQVAQHAASSQLGVPDAQDRAQQFKKNYLERISCLNTSPK